MLANTHAVEVLSVCNERVRNCEEARDTAGPALAAYTRASELRPRSVTLESQVSACVCTMLSQGASVNVR